MNIFKVYKNILLLLITNNIFLAAMDMPHPQLQLTRPKEQRDVIRGTICIIKQAPATQGWLNFVHEPVYYPALWEREYLQKAGISVSLNDPCIPVTITCPHDRFNIKNNSDGKFLRRPIIPVKSLINFSTESVLRLTLYGYPVELICKNNPLINNKPFHKQFEKRMKKFYEKPESWANIGQCAKDELIPAGIVIETLNTNTMKRAYNYGPNGCPNDLELAKHLAKPHNNSMFRHILNRSTGQNPIKTTQPKINTKLLLMVQRGSEYGGHEHCVLL